MLSRSYTNSTTCKVERSTGMDAPNSDIPTQTTNGKEYDKIRYTPQKT